MNADKKIIKKASLSALFDKLKKSGKVVIAPAKKGGKQTEYAEISDFNEFTEDYIQTVQSAKSAVFPNTD